MNYIEQKLIQQFNFRLCYKNKKERIFKNNELLITCKDKFILVFIYGEYDRSKIYDILNWISKG